MSRTALDNALDQVSADKQAAQDAADAYDAGLLTDMQDALGMSIEHARKLGATDAQLATALLNPPSAEFERDFV